MSINILIVAYLILAAIDTHLFFKQRAALDIGRQIGMEIRPLILSSEFNTVSNIVMVVKLAVLAYMCYLGSWMTAAGLGVGLMVVCSILPIPKSYYDDVYRKIGR